MLARIQTLSTSLITKATSLAEKTIYYGKVTGELSKQIYQKEKLQPPALNDFKAVYKNLYVSSLKYIKSPQQVVNYFKATSKDEYLKFGALGIQILAFYSVGEVIGRRKLVGYKNYATAEAHH